MRDRRNTNNLGAWDIHPQSLAMWTEKLGVRNSHRPDDRQPPMKNPRYGAYAPQKWIGPVPNQIFEWDIEWEWDYNWVGWSY